MLLLTVVSQGESSLTLQWHKPADGGEVAAYNVMRRVRGDGDWELAKIAMENESTLKTQPKGAALEYRVIALNKAGHGEASNTVAVVL